MPSNLSIAKMGSQRYLDMTADQHNGKDHAWLIDTLKKLEAGGMTKREICESMNVTGPTLDKYIFVINLEKVQQHNHEEQV
jgi:hypothetical protein